MRGDVAFIQGRHPVVLAVAVCVINCVEVLRQSSKNVHERGGGRLCHESKRP